jgi:hypothetical protein
MSADHQLQKACGQHRQDRLAIERLPQSASAMRSTSANLPACSCASVVLRAVFGVVAVSSASRRPSPAAHTVSVLLVLLGQDLCRSHQRRLMPARHHQLTRRISDQRLARAHIAVKQALHRMRLRQILLESRRSPAPARPSAVNGSTERRLVSTQAIGHRRSRSSSNRSPTPHRPSCRKNSSSKISRRCAALDPDQF